MPTLPGIVPASVRALDAVVERAMDLAVELDDPVI
jgi:hypothetical protein